MKTFDKYTAQEELMKGSRISHRLFDEHEYVELFEGNVVDERLIVHENFWEIRVGSEWDNGWFTVPKVWVPKPTDVYMQEATKIINPYHNIARDMPYGLIAKKAFKGDKRQYYSQPVRTSPKQGRNEPCACGSGKKHKNCCL